MGIHKPSGQIYMVYAPNLNLNLQNPAPAPFALKVYSPSGVCPAVGTQEAQDKRIIMQLSPNPVAIGAPLTLQCYLPESAEVKSRLYDLLGRLVWEAPLGSLPAGDNKLILDAATISHPSGIYYLELGTTYGKGTVKIVLVD
ncbi:MAG: T9SS type A sorting domain-containing protein [Phycisphaerae bacterium]|nr:T9SS type A sorting domain-containing protein [Saprospiraceae bacterium]